MKHILYFFFCSTLILFSCKSEKPAEAATEELKEEPTMTNSDGKKYTLTPFSPSQSYETAKIEGMTFKDSTFDFEVAKGDYKLGTQTADAEQKMCANSAKGQHIHLIVDNSPYSAQYTNNFGYEIEDGDHKLLAFLSRSYHESIKTADAHVAKNVTIKDNAIVSASPIEESMLFYSRPKGNYVGENDTKKVMLDFYPVNAEIGTTHKVIASINNEEHVITKWQPYYITGLPMGENTIELALVDMDGNKISAPLNPVSRTFTLRGETAQR